MVTIEIKRVKLSEIKLNPDNPRTITEKDMARLVKSLKEFPEMMELREIVVDETLTVLGGNMRTLALRQAGAQEVTAKICRGLTREQKREFVIKDNGAFGMWDHEVLLREWGNEPLREWGIRLPDEWGTTIDKTSDIPKAQYDGSIFKKLHVHFQALADVEAFSVLMGQEITEQTRTIWFDPKK